MKRSLSREFASKVVQRSKMHRDSSYDDDDANELLVVAGLIVCGWNIIRAYGSPFSLSLSLSFTLSSSYPLRAVHLPETLYLLFFYFFFFDRYLRFFEPRGTSGLPTRSRLITLPHRCGTLISTHRGRWTLFSAIGYDSVNWSVGTWNIRNRDTEMR